MVCSPSGVKRKVDVLGLPRPSLDPGAICGEEAALELEEEEEEEEEDEEEEEEEEEGGGGSTIGAALEPLVTATATCAVPLERPRRLPLVERSGVLLPAPTVLAVGRPREDGTLLGTTNSQSSSRESGSLGTTSTILLGRETRTKLA